MANDPKDYPPEYPNRLMNTNIYVTEELLASLLFIYLITIFGHNHVFAQTDSGIPTPEHLIECKLSGIQPEKCSEQAILGTKCIGPNEACKDVHVPIDVNVSLIPIYLGIIGAFVASVLYVKKTDGWKVNAQQNQKTNQ